MRKNNATPPRLLLRFFRWFCHPELRKYIEGDLLELYNQRFAESGKRMADLRFLFDVMGLFRPEIIRPVKIFHPINNNGMIRNNFKVGVRTMVKHKAFSFIHVSGLGLAMCVCMLIILMYADQKSYDQFHKKKDRTYRVLSKIQRSNTPNASSPFPLAALIRENYPISEAATHLVPGVGGDATLGGASTEMRGYFADPSFFDVFSFDLEAGNRLRALVAPNSMIISQEKATILFKEEDPIGKTIQFSDRGLRIIQMDFGNEIQSQPKDWGLYTITGVLDTKKYKSHLKFDVLISTASLKTLHHEQKIGDFTDNWHRYSYCYTYVAIHPRDSEKDLESSLNDIVKKQYAGFEDLKGFRLIPQKLTAISPGKFLGNPPSLQLPVEAYYFLGVLALVILVSACVNYTSLSIARALTRAKEIGVRKVNGAKRSNLVFQFLGESLLHVLLAMLLAGGLLLLIKPAFQKLWMNQYLTFDLGGDLYVYLYFVGLSILIALVAGVIPAFHLSGYSPIRTLKKLHFEKSGKPGFLNFLSTSQLVVSLFFIITSILISRQFQHYLDFDYGFTTENIINIPIQGNSYERLSNELGAVPGVTQVSACEFIPATSMTNGIGARKAGSDEDFVSFEHSRVDPNFIENFGLTILAGTDLSHGLHADRFVLVNETAAVKLGFDSPAEIVGQVLEVPAYDVPVEVVGVMKDFQYQTPVMEEKPGPLMFRNQPEHFSYLNLKIGSGNYQEIINALTTKWKSIDPVHPFQYQFFDDQLVKVNQWLGDLVSIIGFLAFLSVFIACLGLLGMATYATERRTREVAIRKVLGAEDGRVAIMLSKQFLKLLFISIFISAPLSYFVNNLWLETFPNHVDFGPGTLLLGTLILLILGFITIGSQTISASRQNPAESLKIE